MFKFLLLKTLWVGIEYLTVNHTEMMGGAEKGGEKRQMGKRRHKMREEGKGGGGMSYLDQVET